MIQQPLLIALAVAIVGGLAVLEPFVRTYRLSRRHGLYSPEVLYAARSAALGVGMVFLVFFLIAALVFESAGALIGFGAAVGLIAAGVRSKGVDNG